MLEVIPEFRPVFVGGKRVENYWAVVNPEDGYVYDIVSRRYKIVPHVLVYDMVRKVIEEPLKEKLEISKHGARMLYDIWFDRWEVEGEQFLYGIRVTNSYDRSLKLGVMLSLFRVVCENGLIFPQYSFANVKFKHSKGLSALDVLDAVKKVVSKRQVIEQVIRKAIEMEIDEDVNGRFRNVLVRKRWQKMYCDQDTAWKAYNEVTRILWRHCSEPYERHRLLERSFGVLLESTQILG